MIRILCSNRDEFLERPTLHAAWHDFPVANPNSLPKPQDEQVSTESGSVLSGVDAQAGGTWFGINRDGKAAFLYVDLRLYS